MYAGIQLDPAEDPGLRARLSYRPSFGRRGATSGRGRAGVMAVQGAEMG
jgi:hypothetical protein